MRYGKVFELMMSNPQRKFKRIAWANPREFIWFIPERDILASKWLGPKGCIQSRDILDDDGTRISEHYVTLKAHMCKKLSDDSVCYWTPDVFDSIADDWTEVF